MAKYTINSEDWSVEYDSLESATKSYEQMKDSMMEDTVQLGDWVELWSTDSDDKVVVIKREVIVEDEDSLKELGDTKGYGMTFEWWAKWVELKV